MHLQKKVNDAMHRFKKCASDTSLAFVSRCIVSNIFASVKNDLYIITSGCPTLLLFRKRPIICDQYFICRFISPLETVSQERSLINEYDNSQQHGDPRKRGD